MNFEQLIPTLKDKLTEGPERVGFILANGDVVEVENVCSEPMNGFEVSGEDLIKHQDAIGSWHTHPGQNSNLSTNDWYGFRSWSEWTHFIVGTDGVQSYRVDEGRVLEDNKWTDEG